MDDPGEHQLGRVIDRCVGDEASVIFVLPTAFDLNIWQRTMLGEELAARAPPTRRGLDSSRYRRPHASFARRLFCRSGPAGVGGSAANRLAQAGLLLVADGHGDPATRADSYRLMRLLWEQTGLRLADVGFVRHAQPFLKDALGRCLREPLDWLLLPQCQWDGELCDYARVMLDDHQRAHPEATGWRLLDAPGDHPAILAWLEQRLLRLWQEKRASQAVRVRSAKHQPAPSPAAVWSGEDWVPAARPSIAPRVGCIARARESPRSRKSSRGCSPAPSAIW